MKPFGFCTSRQSEEWGGDHTKGFCRNLAGFATYGRYKNYLIPRGAIVGGEPSLPKVQKFQVYVSTSVAKMKLTIWMKLKKIRSNKPTDLEGMDEAKENQEQ